MSQKGKNFKEKASEAFKDLNDETKNFTKKEIDEGKGMGILSYILPFIPYFVEKNNKYVKFHAAQGMNLLLIGIAYSILRWILSAIYVAIKCGSGIAGQWCRSLASGWYLPWYFSIIFTIIGIVIGVLCILGIVYVCQGKAKELPILNKLKIFK